MKGWSGVMKEESMTGQSTTGSARSAQGDEKLDFRMRWALSIVGVALIASGVVLAFRDGNGVSTAAILSAGFALTFMAYVGRYLTRIKFRDFEATIDRVEARLERVGTKAVETAASLDNLASRYESVRTSMAPGGERDAKKEEILFAAESAARKGEVGQSTIAELSKKTDDWSRVKMLGFMKGDPSLRDPEIVFQAIANPHSGFDQDRFLLLAGEMLHELNETQRSKLKEIIIQQQAHGEIKPTRIRWLTAERLLRLIGR
jgi:hypothetical protein